MEFEEVIRKRESIRKFNDKPVEDEKLNKILEAGRIAPTAKNTQPFKIYVIKSAEGLEKIDKATPCRYDAKTVLLICGDKDKAFPKEEYPIFVMDVSIVTTHMMLEATNLGVDNIWIEWFDGNILRTEFDIPENLVPTCLLPIGYRATLCPPNPAHNVRKDMDKLVEYR